MEFTFDTLYDQKAVTVMARGLRKTIRKKRSRRSRVFGWLVVALVLLLTLPLEGGPLVVEGQTIITWAAGLVVLITLMFEDKLNAWIARKRMMAGTNRAVSTFTQEGYCSESPMGKTQWHYENILSIAEDTDYFILIFDKNHAQVYDKRTLVGGTAEEFRTFIAEKTGKEVQIIK